MAKREPRLWDWEHRRWLEFNIVKMSVLIKFLYSFKMQKAIKIQKAFLVKIDKLIFFSKCLHLL